MISSFLIKQVWDINPASRKDGTLPLFHEDGYIGNAIRTLFGYRGAPTLLELIAYAAYLGILFPAWRWIERRKNPRVKPVESPLTQE